jgi:hypothetical protein
MTNPFTTDHLREAGDPNDELLETGDDATSPEQDEEFEPGEAAVVDPDVDTPDEDDEADTVAEGTAEAPKDAKAPKAKKESTRTPVPEGFISPVQFAKVLTKHLQEQHATNTAGVPISVESNPVPPQVVYSYINNNKAGKNPFPATYGDTSKGERAVILKAEDGLKWWDELRDRVAKGKEEKANKEAKKEAKKATPEAVETEDNAEVVEAE